MRNAIFMCVVGINAALIGSAIGFVIAGKFTALAHALATAIVG